MEQLIKRENFYVRVNHGYDLTIEEKIERVIEEICFVSRIRRAVLLGPSRKSEVVTWRHLGVYICCVNNYGSLKTIGFQFGGRDHSSIIHGRDKTQDLIDCNDHILIPKYQQVKHIILDQTNLTPKWQTKLPRKHGFTT